MRKLIIATLMIGTCLSGCQTAQYVADDNTVDLRKMQEVTNLDELSLVSGVKFVHPDAKALIGRIDKAVLQDSILYLMSRQNREVYVVTTSGRTLKVISDCGQGDKEYIDLSDIFVDPSNKTLNVVSSQSRRLIQYNAKGNFVAAKELPTRFTSMIALDANHYLGYANNIVDEQNVPYNFCVVDKDMKISARYGKIQSSTADHVYMSHNPFSAAPSGACTAIHSDGYQLSHFAADDMQSSTTLDFGDLALPEQSASMLDDRELQAQNASKYVCSISRAQETDKNLLIFYIFAGQEQLVVCDKSGANPKQINLSATSLKSIYPISFGGVIGSDPKHIITVAPFETVNNLYVGHDEYNDFEKLYPQQIKHLRTVVPAPGDNDNPYILIYDI